MKNLPFALFTVAAVGCGHNEFDVSAAQVSAHRGLAQRPAADQFHLPAGKTEMKFNKGDRLPDGTIANQVGKISSDGR